MATQTQNSDTLDLDSDRDARLMEAFIGLIEGNPEEVVHGWFTTADVQLALYKRDGLLITPEEMRRTLRHFEQGLQIDTYEQIRDRWALYDPNSVQSLLRLADRQASGRNFTTAETEYLSKKLTRVVGGEETKYLSVNGMNPEAIRSLIDAGVLEWEERQTPEEDYLTWAGRLGEYCSMGGCGESFFEDLPMEHGDYIPDADWGWRHGGIMYLSDSKTELQDKIRSVWDEHRRDSPVPAPNTAEFESVMALALDFEVELVPSDWSDWA